MNRLWIAVRPSSTGTRVLAMKGSRTLLRAKLKRRPSHQRGLTLLLEALALWQGEKVHAALCVDGADGAFPRFQPEYDDTLLYGLEWVPGHRRADEEGAGDFRELHRLLAWEAAR